MEASKVLALKAQESSENMELMTKDMHIVALKTKSETVSMRIITLVTLFFLPGTFISVSGAPTKRYAYQFVTLILLLKKKKLVLMSVRGWLADNHEYRYCEIPNRQ
jgi:hypothetical protein